MFRTKPFYTIIFSLYIVLVPFTSNMGQISPFYLLRPFLVILMSTLLIIGIINIFIKNFLRSSYLSLLVLFCLLFFGHFLYLLEVIGHINIKYETSLQILSCWIILFIFLSIKPLWIKLRSPQSVTYFLNIFMIVLTIPALVQALIYFARNSVSDTFTRQTTVTYETNNYNNVYPDIYVFIMDTYGREDVLDELYGLDNSDFLNFLKRNGFYIANDSISNYSQTAISISSLLDYDYPRLPNDSQKQIEDTIIQKHRIANNKLMVYLHQKGYTTIALETGYYVTELTQADIYYQSFLGLNDLESSIYSKSAVGMVLRPLGSYEINSQRILHNFELLQTIPKIPGPKFVFAHFLLPHPPFMFDQDGNIRFPDLPFSRMDGSGYPGTKKEYILGYKNQVLFTNKMLKKTVEEILEQSRIQPIIIIQGDHGPGAYFVYDEVDKTCLWERTGILNAYLLPLDKQKLLYPSISPVNSFRIIFNAIFNENLELLEDKSYFFKCMGVNCVEEDPIIDITSMIEDKDNCPSDEQK